MPLLQRHETSQNEARFPLSVVQDDGMDGRGYLEKLIADSLGAGKGQPALGRQNSFNRFEIRGVAIGLVAAGALRQEEAEQILADLEVTLQRSGWLTVVRQETSATSSGEAVARRVGIERPEWRRAIEDPPTPVLRHIVPLVGRSLTIGEVTANLVSLEVWSTFLALNLAHVDIDARRMRERFGPGVRWRGWDDVGTQYRGGGGGGSGSHVLFVERCTLEPGPPEQARALTLVVEHPGGQTTVPIPLPAGQQESGTDSSG
ncbi:hypothetical protein [Saccharopolyspora endophytica]|uniref:hypothetical protein n=1 Tax=Saccharopolyspora endophytica TaxID=543886 RepID=UPI001B3689CE|nr:hypothetical protein [Saccharopolyspora endophytica]